ncbi:malate:quinone oxidoreductase [Sphingomonas sp. RB3P16]|uniref:malate:quinone oxidoreductase n=1 Tax=Parasphingomonas frigoris TaxID=3096163 RepID=UPI002FCC8EFB
MTKPKHHAGEHALKLEEYLADQVVLSERGRIETLRQFYPNADPADWTEAVAVQRVQVIKPNGHGGGTLAFGTALVGAADGSFIALMGASPGASTAASIAIDVLRRCFADRLTETAWLPRLRAMIPTYGIDLKADAEACRRTRAATATVLGLADIARIVHHTEGAAA